MQSKPRPHHEVSARVHFLSGIALIAVVAFLSASLHGQVLFRNLQFTNLDVLFLSNRNLSGAERIAVVSITDSDYAKLFDSRSPLYPAVLGDLIVACARSGAGVIGVDLITSDWSAEQRRSVMEAARREQPAVRVVWAVDGWVDDATGKPHAAPIKGLDTAQTGSCQAVPAAIPDDLGVVRGYLPGIRAELNGTLMTIPSMAEVIDRLSSNPAADCLPDEPADPGAEEHFVNFSGGRAFLQNLSARTVKDSSESESWKNDNPLKGRIVLIGGSFRYARDRYMTPAGYRDGVSILAQTILSLGKHGIRETSQAWFVGIDILVGLTLLTATWYLHRLWVLALSFVLIPFVAMAASFIAFSGFGYFTSFIPVVSGVFLHHLGEYVVEHRRMTKELKVLRQGARNEEGVAKEGEHK